MVECGAELSEQVGLQDNFLFLLFSLVKGTTWEWQNLSFSVVHGWYVLVRNQVVVDFWIWPDFRF